MVITSESKSPTLHRYADSQLAYAVVYVVITFVVLLFLNIYCSNTSQRLFYQSQESSMLAKCLLASNRISELEIINPTTLERAIEQINGLKVTRLVVTDPSGIALYDSSQTGTNRYVLLPEIITALEGNDVFSWKYHDGVMYSTAATPVVSYGTTLGCVYMTEHDASQGFLLQSLQYTVLQITVILETVVILFSFLFSQFFSLRLREIMSSMRIIQQGDYTHKLQMTGNDELRFLADEFNELTDKLQTSEEKRRRFVSDASHELKTPLASIKLLTDSILQNDMDMETVREFVEDIGNEADRLNRTSSKLLSLTRSDMQIQEEAEIIDMAPTIERVIHMLSGIAQQNGVTICPDIQRKIPVLLSEDDLYQIAFNLVENGIKYNVPGGSLTVRVFRRGENAVLQVRDTGMGIPKESLSHVFERFYRVDKARSRASGGSGLGLSIVQSIVRKHRGEISVDSTLGKGSVFTVTFPIFDTEAEFT